jgi:endonuclease/exonuclease/phosphatase family metal-dependent hydrolase
MPFYYAIRSIKDEAVRRRTAEGLLRLQKQLDAEVPSRTVTETLLLATWNIREFDSSKFGFRGPESLHYIAEIISRFDLVAIQEVREDLSALDEVQRMLGGWWKYIVTDVTVGTGGNGERMAFIYDSRKVSFGGVAGEIVLPPKKDIPTLQFSRTPFMCGFRAGWVKFNLCTVHIYYGKAVAEDRNRLREIATLAQFLAQKVEPPKQPARPQGEATAVKNTSGENLVLLGDFNIFSREDKTFKALTDAGFEIPRPLREVPGSNLGQSKHFDQIAFLCRSDRFESAGQAGVFNYSSAVFRDEDEAGYAAEMAEGYAKQQTERKKSNYYKQWRTFQMSDHLLLWCALRIDFSREYLERQQSQDAAAGASPDDERAEA